MATEQSTSVSALSARAWRSLAFVGPAAVVVVLLGIAALARPEFKIEVEAIAVVEG